MCFGRVQGRPIEAERALKLADPRAEHVSERPSRGARKRTALRVESTLIGDRGCPGFGQGPPARWVVCPFCAYPVHGLPGHAVFSDELCYVILDRESLGFGHCLVIPTAHADTIFDLPEAAYEAVFRTARRLAPSLSRATGRRCVGSVSFGVGMPHAHLHLVPMDEQGTLLRPEPRLLSEQSSQVRQRV